MVAEQFSDIVQRDLTGLQDRLAKESSMRLRLEGEIADLKVKTFFFSSSQLGHYIMPILYCC